MHSWNNAGPSAAQPTHSTLEGGPERHGIGNYDLIGPGFASPQAPLDDRLSYYQGLDGGDTVDLPGNEAALRVDGSIVVATATTAAEGGFLDQEDYFCDGFQPRQSGTPAIEPVVSTVPSSSFQPEVSATRRGVCATPRFFEDLDQQLRGERVPNGEPSTNDFQ